MIGKVLADRYQLLAKIGEGGMAVVFRAKDTLLGRLVAVKVLRDQYAGDAEFIDRFHREARAAASLSHPNVVNIFDVGEEDDSHFIVMEYVNGRNLKEILRRDKRVEPAQAAFIAGEVAKALDVAHRRDLVHRDIKPHNILITEDGSVKVTDFGIARAASTATLTQTGTIMGSVHYFSPEQARGEHVGKASDIYSLGVVLYEMVTGQLPFQGENAISVALKHLQETPPSPRQMNPSVPKALDAIIRRALAKTPEERYASVAAFLDDIHRFLGTEEQPRIEFSEGPSPSDGQDAMEATRVVRASGELEETRIRPVREDADVKDRQKKPKSRRGRKALIFMAFFIFFAAGILWAVQKLPALIFPEEVRVPDIVGMNVDDAEASLKEQGLKFGVDRRTFHPEVPVNHIVSQDPEGNRRVKMGRTIFAVVSRGPEFVTVPDVVGLTLREAKLRVTQAGLTLGELSDKFDLQLPPNSVVAQNPEGGSRLQKGLSVDFVVSKGAEPGPTVILPDFRGTTLEESRRQLGELGLRVGRTLSESSTLPPGTVLDQNPAANTEVRVGSEVDLIVSQTEAPPPDTGGNPPSSGPADGQETPGGQTDSNRQWRQASVSVTVQEGPPQEVVVFVIDDFGAREVYRKVVKGGTTITQIVRGRGDEARVQVYIGGNMISEEPFPSQ